MGLQKEVIPSSGGRTLARYIVQEVLGLIPSLTLHFFSPSCYNLKIKFLKFLKVI